MSRPKLKMSLTHYDKILIVFTMLGLILLIALPAFYYNKLPETIPIHFGLDGQPDSYGQKATIWVLTIIGVMTFSLLSVITKFPHTFNYTVKITEANAKTQYKIAIQMLHTLNAICTLGFAYISYVIIQNGLGNTKGLGYLFLILFLTMIFGSIIYFSLKSKKAQ